MTNEDVRELNIENVLNSALELFNENGVESVTFGMIAKRSGVTERSVHRYFESRQALLLAAATLLVQTRYDYIFSELDTPEYEGMSGLEQIEAMLRRYAKLLVDDCASFVTISAIETALVRSGDHNLFELYYGDGNQFVDKMRQSIIKGKGDGSLPDTEYDDMSVYTLFVFFRGLLRRLSITCTSQNQKDTAFCMSLIDRGVEMIKFWLSGNGY